MVDELRREVDARSDASNQRIKAARERAARERSERVKMAQTALAAIKQQRKAREQKRSNGKPQKEPRASTTDPDARVMKMADGGFRPAYNVQVASVADEQIVVAVAVCNSGSDRGLMRPMLERLGERLGQFPRGHLADGGFTSAQDIEWAHGNGIEVYCPATKSKHGTDPVARAPATAPASWPGAPGWAAQRARRNTNPAQSVNASTPAGATGRSGNCWSAASTRSALSCSSTPSPTTSCRDTGLPARKHKGRSLWGTPPSMSPAGGPASA